MSGGYFDYNQYKIKEIIEKLQDDLKSDFKNGDKNFDRSDYDRIGNSTPSEREHCIYHIQALVEDLEKVYNKLDALDLFLSGDTDADEFLKACKD